MRTHSNTKTLRRVLGHIVLGAAIIGWLILLALCTGLLKASDVVIGGWPS